MKKNSLVFCLMLLFLLSLSSQCFGAVLNVEAYIDGKSQLKIQGSDVWWYHMDYSAPGWKGDGYYATLLDHNPWEPTWPGPDPNSFCNCESSKFTGLSPALGTDGVPIQLSVISGRELVYIAQQPSAGNGYTAIIEFNDNNEPGAGWYRIDITYSDFTPPPIPTLGEWGMIIFALLMAAAAIVLMRRRKNLTA